MINKIKEILSYSERVKAQEILLSAEIMASKTNLPVSKIIEKMIEQGEKNQFVKEIDKRIKSKKYTKKFELYKGVLDEDVVNILKSAHESGVGGEEIIYNYISSKKIVNKVAGKLRTGVIEPLILFFLVSMITWYGIYKLKSEFSKFPKFDITLLSNVYIAMPLIAIIPIVLVLVGIFKYPHKMPFIKNVWLEVKSTLYLSLLLTIYNLNLYSKVLYFFLQVKDPYIMKAYQKLPAEKKKKQTEGVFTILSRYLTPTEKATLTVAIAYNSEKEAIENITSKRLSSIEMKTEVLTVLLNRLGIVGAIIPVALYVLCMFSSVNQVMDIAATKGMQGQSQTTISTK